MNRSFEELRNRVVEKLSAAGFSVDGRREAREKRRVLMRVARETAWEMGLFVDPGEGQEALERLADEILGLGAIETLLRDEEITEIMVNGPRRVYIEKGGRLHLTDIVFEGDQEVHRIIDRIIGPLGLHVDEASPYVDARLPDGSRVNVILPPLSLLGPVVTIRRFRRRPITLEELVRNGTLDDEEAFFLAEQVRRKRNLLISGGAGTGKTTLLNALSAFIGPEERIITLEDAAELRLQQHHVIPLETRPPNLEGKGAVTLQDLLCNALRMRPDRIIIGEVRGAEALDLLQALNTGHRGSLTTIHANSPLDALRRFETMVLTAGAGLHPRLVREQVSSVIDVLAHMERDTAGMRKLASLLVLEPAGEEGTPPAETAFARVPDDVPPLPRLRNPLPERGRGFPRAVPIKKEAKGK